MLMLTFFQASLVKEESFLICPHFRGHHRYNWLVFNLDVLLDVVHRLICGLGGIEPRAPWWLPATV